MPESRGARIVLEVAFLAVVTAVLAAARVEPAWIVLVMLLAWALVALLEWVAWHDEPHWASGHPPRYYVPSRRLPPRPPTQELPPFTLAPPPREHAPTSIAPAQLRDDLLAEASAAAAAAQEDDDWNGWPDGHLHESEADPWAVEELPARPEAEPDPAPVAVDPEPEPEPEPEVEPEVEPEPAPVESAPPRPVVLARHRIEPFAEPAARHWPWQRPSEAPAAVELPSLPRHRRPAVGGRR